MTVFRLSDAADFFPSTAQNDLLNADDAVFGLGGDDQLTAGRGDDRVYGGDGNDTLTSVWQDAFDTGADLLVGGSGADVIFAQAGAAEDDTVQGGAGNDSIYGGLSMSGGDGDDGIRTFGVAQMIAGDAGNDTITANWNEFGAQVATLSGGDGEDFLGLYVRGSLAPLTLTLGGDVRVRGEVKVHLEGFEFVGFRTESNRANLRGGAEVDQFIISGNAAKVDTGAGSDIVTVDYSIGSDGGTYRLDGGLGFDVLKINADGQSADAIHFDWSKGLARIGNHGRSSFAGFERLEVVATVGNDTIYGGEGYDQIDGSSGNDILWGKDGFDVLTGGIGADSLTGGAGADLFVYRSQLDSAVASADQITRFEGTVGAGFVDRIDLSAVDSGLDDVRFTFIGQAAFTAAGQVRVQAAGKDTWILVNADADLAAEMKIVLTDFVASALGAEDFIL